MSGICPTPSEPLNTTRTRSGCVACRRRKKKCDEARPKCSACTRLDIRCEFPEWQFEFVHRSTSTFKYASSGGGRPLQKDIESTEHTRETLGKVNQSVYPASMSRDGRLNEHVGTSVTPSRTPPYAYNAQTVSEYRFDDISAHVVKSSEASSQMMSSAVSQSEDSDVAKYTRSSCYGAGLESSPQPVVQGLEQQVAHEDITSKRSGSADLCIHPPRQNASVWQPHDRSTSRPVVDSMQPLSIQRQHEMPSGSWFSTFVDASNLAVHDRLDTTSLQPRLEHGFYNLQEKLYLNHWRFKLKEPLPAVFQQFEDLAAHSPSLKLAILSLSACDLAQSQTEIRCRKAQDGNQWFYAPGAEHQNYGRLYYSAAIKELARMDYGKKDSTSVFATLLLFIYIEAHIGSFQGAAFHHHCIEHILEADHRFCGATTFQRSLAIAWTALRAHNWSKRIPYITVNFNQSLLDIGVDIGYLHDPCEARAESIVVNMLQTWRLSLMILFDRYVGRGDIASISSRCCQDHHFRLALAAPPGWEQKVAVPDEDYVTLINEQRNQLDRWYVALPPSQFPIQYADGSRMTEGMLSSSLPSACLSELRFANHSAATNYIYYLVARIVQSGAALDDFLSAGTEMNDSHMAGRELAEVDQWLATLLQIIANLDINAYTRDSRYTVGLFEVLKMCQLRLPRSSSTICGAANQLMERLNEHCMSSDGSMSIRQFTHDLEIINDQRKRGRDLFYVMPSFSPDAEGETVAQADHEGVVVIVYGRDRIAGKLFCEGLVCQ